jgi:hypothetical protein
MWMKQEILSPTVKYGKESDLRSQVLRVRRDGGQRFGGNAEKNVVDRPLVLKSDGGDLLWHGKYNVKIRNLQKFGLTVLDPLRSGKGLAFRTVSIPAAIETIPLMATLIALLKVAAKRRRAAHLNCGHDAPLGRGHRRAMLPTIGCAVAAEDIRHFQLRAIHEAAAQKY